MIDHSSSMKGEKIAMVKKTLTSILALLTEHDRICIIEFDH